MMLPKIGGLALFFELKKHENVKDVPVIFMSGAIMDEEFHEKGIEIGAVDFITKPIDLQAFKAKLTEILG